MSVDRKCRSYMGQ